MQRRQLVMCCRGRMMFRRFVPGGHCPPLLQSGRCKLTPTYLVIDFSPRDGNYSSVARVLRGRLWSINHRLSPHRYIPRVVNCREDGADKNSF